MTARKSPLSVASARRTAAVALGGPARAAVGEDGAFSYGFDRADGTLSRGAGASCYIAAAALPAGEEAAGLFGLPAGGAEALYCRSGKLYARTAGAFSDTGVNFAAVPAAVRFFDGAEEKLALSDGVSVAVLGAQGCAAAEGIPPFSAAAFWYERLWTFAGSGAEYSAPADPASFAAARGGGGSVSFPDAAGKIEAAVTFRGGLFLLRGRGVQELSARGDERAFCLGDVCACPRLYGATAAAAPEGVFWLSESGLCRFDGSKVQPFAEDFAGFFAGVEQPAARELRAVRPRPFGRGSGGRARPVPLRRLGRVHPAPRRPGAGKLRRRGHVRSRRSGVPPDRGRSLCGRLRACGLGA